MSKLHKLLIKVEMVTDLDITSTEVIDALHNMVYAHSAYDKEETVAAIPHVQVVIE